MVQKQSLLPKVRSTFKKLNALNLCSRVTGLYGGGFALAGIINFKGRDLWEHSSFKQLLGGETFFRR
jgi:hypothetical protein